MARMNSSYLLSIIVLLLVRTPSALASCYYDSFGRYTCSSFSTGVRIGIAVAIVVAGLVAVCCLFFMRRRRIAKYNQSYIPTTNANTIPPANAGYYQSQSYGGGGYPPQQYNSYNQPAGEYPQAPQAAHTTEPAPPSYYAPPAAPYPGAKAQ